MFSTGQIIFAALFVVAFAFLVIVSYKKDRKLHLKNYQGVKWVAIIFVIFILILFSIKYFLKK